MGCRVKIPAHQRVSKQMLAGKLHPKQGQLGRHRLTSGTSEKSDQ